MKKRLPVFFTICCFILITSCYKDKKYQNGYFPEVKSIIHNNCIVCHSSTDNWSGRPIAFDTDSSIALQYASIKASVADPVSPFNRRMPQGGTLSNEEIDIIVKWYNKGGKTTD